jgi:hypothetical protein
MPSVGCHIVESRWMVEGVAVACFRLSACRDSGGHQGVLLSDQEVAVLRMATRGATRL